MANPDYAQRRVREYALLDGKELIMASPRLKRGYLILDPREVRGLEALASTIKGALRFGKPLKVLPRPDLVLTGCVAVDRCFYRLGKGGGYGDREIATIQGLFGPVTVVTTVHEAQLIERVPREPHDTRVDVVVTPIRVLRRTS